MKNVDYVQISLIANIVAMVIAGATAIVLALNNSGSKNLPLAAAALVGVMLAFGIQLPFELSGSREHETIGVELTTDRTQPVIRQWVYDDATAGWRLPVEVGASNWLAKKDPKIFDELPQRDKVSKDLIVFSLLSFLTHEEYDWQLERKSYLTIATTRRVSNPNECSVYTAVRLNEMLLRAKNVFSGIPLQVASGELCLPAGTSLEISEDALALQNRFCRISFRIEAPLLTLYVDPKTRAFVGLPSGEQRYEIRTIGINVETVFFRLRAQHADSKRYREWSSRLVTGVRTWFTPGNRSAEPQQLVVP